MKVNRVIKKQLFSLDDIIRFQLMTELMFFKSAVLTTSELDILVELIKAGEVELGAFCTKTTHVIYDIERMEDFAVKSQNVRNIINKLFKKGIVEKIVGKGKRLIKLSSDIEVYYQGNVLIDYNFLCKQDESVKEE